MDLRLRPGLYCARIREQVDYGPVRTGPERGNMEFRGFNRVLALVAAIATCAFALLAGDASASDPGDVSPLGGDKDYCVSEDGSDGAGNAGACIDGTGLDTGIAAMAVTPNGTRLQTIGFGGTGLPSGSNGNSVSTYDRNALTGEVELQPRPRACISQSGTAPCSSGGTGYLTRPTGIAISPDGQNVYVTAGVSNALNVFDYIALPDPVNFGPLQQKVAGGGCLTASSSGSCTTVRGNGNASDVVISPDGEHVYTAGNMDNIGGIAVFDRAADGLLTQKGVPEYENYEGCVNDNGNNSCTNGNHVEPLKLAISPDGKNLYAASQNNSGTNDAISVFDINPDGTIDQKAGAAGCIGRTDLGGDCTPAPFLRKPSDISVSPDGAYVYVTSTPVPDDGETSIGNLYVFGRNTTTGALVSATCYAAEAENGCVDTDGLYNPVGVLATDDAVYVASIGRSGGSGGVGAKPGALVVLNRDLETDNGSGILTQKPFDGCYASGFLADCVKLPVLVGARSLAVSPGGESLYVGGGEPFTGSGFGAITVFDRDDGIPPSTTIDSGPDNEETSANPVTFTFSADEPGSEFECAIDGGSPAFFPCSSPASYSNLGLGIHHFYVRAIDKSGNVEASFPGRTFTVVKETVPPETTIDSGPEGSIIETTTSFTFSSNEAGTFECRMDSEAFAACASPKQFTGLAGGVHTFQVRAIDTAGNVDATPAERSFTLFREPVGPTCETDLSLCPDTPDTNVDALVTAAKLQKQKRSSIDIKVLILANEEVNVQVTGLVKRGKVKAGLKPVSKKLLHKGTPYLIHIRAASAKAGRLVAAALLGSRRATPKIFITLTDGAMNRVVVKPKVKIQGAPKKR